LKLNTLVESVDPVEGSVDKRRQLYPANHRITCLVVMGSPFDSEQVFYICNIIPSKKYKSHKNYY
jgi:hypothetical protein